MAEQPKKPPGAKDISDLKARLGLKKDAGGAPIPGPAPVAAAPSAAPAPGGAAPMPSVSPASRPPIPGAPAPAPAPAPAAPPDTARDPFAAMKPQGGQMFDLRTIDDGKPAESIQAKGKGGSLVITAIVGLVAFGVGAGFGGAAIGRKAFNSANASAKAIKTELEGMQKTLSEVGRAVAMSQQRLTNKKQDALAYDPELTADFEKLKLDPRPDTSKIFRTDFMRLEDMVVDRLFNYYYDSIALYGEVERHVKKTIADKETLASFAQKESSKEHQANYGVVFDTSGKLAVANLVEVGEQVCKGGGKDCPAADLVGFKVRMNTGSSWYDKKSTAKVDQANVVPLKPTPLMDAVMSGSPDQVRMESYKQRVNNIRMILARITASQKELMDGVSKAASRPDLFTLF